MSGFKNDLQFASSPYLLQHAENPVNWEEWSPEVLERAQQENKPILISVGYAACHWCHVMAHESFEDTGVAELMNTHFICIKIDREERPDIDHIYMEAAQMLTGRGGWPLNAFALPDGRPFYAATYFPKENWKKVLSNIAKAYSRDYKSLLDTAEKLTDGIQLAQELSPAEEGDIQFSKSEYQDLMVNWQKIVDGDRGGFKGAPKFPMANSWQFLLQYYDFTKEHSVLEMVTKTLDEMALGGIYDQIGGGFSRYSVDADWFSPHFEKMLYDNALSISLYANTQKLAPKPIYKQVITDTIDFVSKELMSKDYGFYASLDADSEGEEGKYYVWSYKELSEVLTEEELNLAQSFYNVTERGNWESPRNILFSQQTPDSYAKAKNLNPEKFQSDLNQLKHKLYQIRWERPHPPLDHKIITSWNAMMITGLVDAYTALKEPEYLDLAEKNAQFLLASMMTENGKLLRTKSSDSKFIYGFLDDYAFLVEALIKVYQVSFNILYLNTAKDLVNICLEDFLDSSTGLFYYSSTKGEQLISKTFEINDNVIPASNSSLAKSLFLMGHFFDDSIYTKASEKMWNQVRSKLHKSGPYYANWQILSGWFSHPFYEVAIMGKEAKQKALELQHSFCQNSIFLGGHEENLALLKGKLPRELSETKIYVCEHKTCQQPTIDVDVAKEQLEIKG
ncbi:thioredoxin domain-containing protein [Psychroflexus gondwanensis ACAM 44]|uniref:Thioredoxin domain-containing protein n=1 Tax=Psychroflexus gondwanensis ACAM 44 TaxID=1189619 RepID=N1WTT7_9FLAO|nr:thioredoxin domain-containing protein [Psychroflexus gondwanensis]EMY80612.1 thioredoxin domain-containing protein [Psychroflexus gondwanensis ACAM 44]